MHQGSDYSSYYAPPPPNPNSAANPINPNPSFASAPPYSPYSADYQPYSSPPAPPSYVAPFSPTSEPVPPSAPSYAQPSPQFSTFQPHSAPSYPPDPAHAPPTANYPHLQQSSNLSYYPYEQSQQSGGYAAHVSQIGGANMAPAQSSSLSGSYAPYDAEYQSSGRFDQGGGYLNENSGGGYGGYSHGRAGYGQDFLDGRSDNGRRFDRLNLHDDAINEGAYAYDGGRSEPYGARGTVPNKSPTLFDDYGRSLSLPSSGKDHGGSTAKIVRAVPKADTQQDVKNGVQKYRVKLLSEGGGGTQDVLCQIGLDGIRMLDPSTSRTLRIYPLENLTRWEKSDSSTFSFWSKSSVDIDARRIRLQSNSYTTNTILDTVTAATVQLKEMGGTDSLTRGKAAADAAKQTEQAADKKKGIIDWMNLIKPVNEEKDHWVPDDAVNKCTSCGSDFGAFNRRHHCRNCGDIFCDKCTQGRIALTNDENAQPVRVCDRCMAEVSQRLASAKEAANKPAALHSHEDLARKLQEEMEKNRKSSSGSKSSDSSGRRMREVACPICTVHLQVQVPTSGSETIECGVCQHPFLVSAH